MFQGIESPVRIHKMLKKKKKKDTMDKILQKQQKEKSDSQ